MTFSGVKTIKPSAEITLQVHLQKTFPGTYFAAAHK
jgi:hypothetical protein